MKPAIKPILISSIAIVALIASYFIFCLAFGFYNKNRIAKEIATNLPELKYEKISVGGFFPFSQTITLTNPSIDLSNRIKAAESNPALAGVPANFLPPARFSDLKLALDGKCTVARNSSRESYQFKIQGTTKINFKTIEQEYELKRSSVLTELTLELNQPVEIETAYAEFIKSKNPFSLFKKFSLKNENVALKNAKNDALIQQYEKFDLALESASDKIYDIKIDADLKNQETTKEGSAMATELLMTLNPFSSGKSQLSGYSSGKVSKSLKAHFVYDNKEKFNSLLVDIANFRFDSDEFKTSGSLKLEVAKHDELIPSGKFQLNAKHEFTEQWYGSAKQYIAELARNNSIPDDFGVAELLPKLHELSEISENIDISFDPNNIAIEKFDLVFKPYKLALSGKYSPKFTSPGVTQDINSLPKLSLKISNYDPLLNDLFSYANRVYSLVAKFGNVSNTRQTNQKISVQTGQAIVENPQDVLFNNEAISIIKSKLRNISDNPTEQGPDVSFSITGNANTVLVGNKLLSQEMDELRNQLSPYLPKKLKPTKNNEQHQTNLILSDAENIAAQQLLEKEIGSIKGITLWLNSITGIDSKEEICSWRDTNPQKKSNLVVSQENKNQCPVYSRYGIGFLPSLQFSNHAFLVSDAKKGGLVPLVANTKNFTYVAVWQPSGLISPGECCASVFEQNSAIMIPGARAAMLMLASSSDGTASKPYGLNGESNDYQSASTQSGTPTISVIAVSKTQPTAKTYNVDIYTNSKTAINRGVTNGNVINLGADMFCVGIKCSTKTENFDGLISEIIIFNRTLNQAEIEKVIDALAKKYGIIVD